MNDKDKPIYYGTVTPYPNFNASDDTAILRRAIESKGACALSRFNVYTRYVCFNLDDMKFKAEIQVGKNECLLQF